MKFLGFFVIFGAVAAALVVGGLTAFQRALLYFPSKRIVAPALPGVEDIRIATPDGERLRAWYLPAPKGAPVFLFFDGNGGHPEAWPDRWQEIAQGGAGFLAVYYRGYSGSTGRPTEQGLITDGRAGYDWLIAKGYAPGDIVLHGFSLGCSVALHVALDRPVRALILEAPFTAAVDVAARAFPLLPVRHLMWDQFRSRELIARISVPILIAHGDRDRVVPLAMGKEMFRLANEPKAFVPLRGSSHMTLVRDGLYNHIWTFLETHPPTPRDKR